FFHFIARQDRAQLLVQALDDRPRCAGRRGEAVILYRLETGQAGFRGGRHVRHRRRAFVGGDREPAQLAGGDIADRGRNGVEPERHVIAEEIVGQRAGALVAHNGDLGAGQQIEQLRREVIDGRRRRRAGGQLARRLLRQRDHVGERFCRQRWIGVDDDRGGGDEGNRPKILVHVIT